MKNNRFYQNLKREFEEHPLETVAIATAAGAILVKLIQASTEHNNSKTWKKEVERRRMKDTL